jgi:hypothetical protein
MRAAVQRPLPAARAAASIALAGVALAGCGKGGSEQIAGGGPTRKLAPVAAQGAVGVATRNTTRLGGAGASSDAAAVARAVYPGLTAATRPLAAVLVNERDWHAALAASVLAAAPTGAPILFADGERLPPVSRETLEAMHPLGAPALGGAQVIRIGTSAALPGGLLARQLPKQAPASAAAAVARLALELDRSHAPRQAIVLAEDAPRALAMPAAGLAAESGAPILLVSPTGVPAASAAALASLHRPSMYAIDAAAIGHRTLHELRRLGHVRLISSGTAGHAEAAVRNAIEVARFTDGVFGWGVKEPGHGLVFANAGRPLDAPAAALLSASGDYGPLLLLSGASRVPAPLAGYLSDIQPAYTSAPQFMPVRGVYNHGWLIGDELAISTVTQAEIDTMLEISPRAQGSEEPSESEEPSVSEVE